MSSPRDRSREVWPFVIGILLVLMASIYFLRQRLSENSALDGISQDREFHEKKVIPADKNPSRGSPTGQKSFFDFFRPSPKHSPLPVASPFVPPLQLMPYPRFILTRKTPKNPGQVQKNASSTQGQSSTDSTETESQDITLYSAEVRTPTPKADAQAAPAQNPTPTPSPESETVGPYQARLSVLSEFSYGECREALGGGCPLKLPKNSIPADLRLRRKDRDPMELGMVPIVEGEITIPGLFEGEYYVELRVPGFVARTSPRIEVRGSDVSDASVLMTPGDVDGDGVLHGDKDELALLGHIRSGEYLLNADLNGDAKVDNQDLDIWKQVKRKYRL